MIPSGLRNLPIGARIGLLVAGAGALAAVVALAPSPINYLVVGLVVTGVVALALYALAVRVFDRRRIGPFELRLGENTGASPTSVRDPAARARLDDLRKKFEQGVHVFREHGKDLYSIPWYLIVGEPGSGKTEAVRHSGVGFPPGLQDELQGAGGTLNMNWWFTNHAVILDTAGRLLFEDVEPGTTSEWKEFLRLLRQSRPNCPVNGMVLVVPADSLIQDTGEQIETKAGRIASQLDMIQRALGVRFPVFVVITKADLINGFREFFDELTDPNAAHQMLGWSNPGSLDDMFDPRDVESHLRSVRERLLRRRLRLVAEPSGSDGSRLERADALYAFPDSLARIAPRLRRYLDMIFVQGEWSARPLFLRGIYFTSSMREGSALDQDLAEVLGVDVASLPEGRVWERDRSYFLRDLFLGKIFKEQGLVTRAASVSKTRRKRQLAVLSAAAIAIAGVAAATWIGDRQLRTSIIDPGRFWGDVARLVSGPSADVSDLEIVYYDAPTGSVEYLGGTPAEIYADNGMVVPSRAWGEATFVELQDAAARQASDAHAPPLVFAPVAAIWGDPFARTGEAQRAVFERTTLAPLVERARSRLATLNAEDWDEGATGALAQLMALDLASRSESAGAPNDFDLQALALFVLAQNQEASLAVRADDGAMLQGVLERTYAQGGWPPDRVVGAPGVLSRAVEEGVAKYIEHWSGQGGAVSSTLVELESLADAGEAFGASERALLALGAAALVSDDWDAAYGALVDSGARLDRAWLDARAAFETEPSRLGERVREEAFRDADRSFQTLLDVVEAGSDQGDAGAAMRSRLQDARRSLEASVDRRLADALARVERLDEIVREDQIGDGAYAPRLRAFGVLDAARASGARPEGVHQATETFEKIAAIADRAERDLREQLSAMPSGPGARRLGSFGEEAIDRLALVGRTEVVEMVLTELGRDADAVGRFVRRRGGELGTVERPVLPLTRLDGGVFEPAFHAGATRELFETLAGVAGAIESEGGVENASRAGDRLAEAQRRAGAYAREYLAYWCETVPADATPQVETSWEACIESLGRIRPLRVSPDLAALTERILDAIDAVPDDVVSSNPTANSLRGVLAAELPGLRNERAWLRDTALVIDAWRGLSGDVATARSRVLGMRAASFQVELIPHFEDSRQTGPGAGYWSSLEFNALLALAVSAHERAQQARDLLRDEARGFPACLDSDRTLTPDEVTRAAGLLSLLDLPASEGSAGRNFIGDGALGSLPTRVQEQLKKLRGDLVWTSTQQRRWFDRVRASIGLVSDPTDPLFEELVILRAESQADPGVASRFDRVEVWLGERRLFLSGERSAPAGRLNASTGVRLQLPVSEALQLRLFAGASATPAAVADLPAPWSGLVAVRQSTGPMNPDDVSPEGLPITGVWRLSLELTEPDGRPLRAPGGAPLRYSIGVRFDGPPIPDPTTWATEATWAGAP